MIARPEVHSTSSGCRPGERISMLIVPSGTAIASPIEIKSSQCSVAGVLAVVAALPGVEAGPVSQQKLVLPSSAVNTGTDNSEMNDFPASKLPVTAEGAVTIEKR